MFPASGVRPNSGVPEEFPTLTRFGSEDDSRTRPVASASDLDFTWTRRRGTEIRPQVFWKLIVPRGLKARASFVSRP